MADVQHDAVEQEARRDDKVASEAPAREPVKAPEGIHVHMSENAPQEPSQKHKKTDLTKVYPDAIVPKNGWDRFVARVRDHTPASIVNSGPQINFGLKATADGMSVWSGLRDASRSPSRVIGSVITLMSEVLGLFYKEKPIPEQQQKDYKKMNMLQYAGTKIKEGFDPKNHIFETHGLATIVNGGFLAHAGYARLGTGKGKYEFIQGLVTSVAGGIMTLMPDRERAWQVSHLLFLGRIPVAYKDAVESYRHQGDWQKGAKLVLNQASNIPAEFWSGVKKLPDGTVVRIGKDEDDLSNEQTKQLGRTTMRSKQRHEFDAKEAHNGQPAQPGTQVEQIAKHETTVAAPAEAPAQQGGVG